MQLDQNYLAYTFENYLPIVFYLQGYKEYKAIVHSLYIFTPCYPNVMGICF